MCVCVANEQQHKLRRAQGSVLQASAAATVAAGACIGRCAWGGLAAVLPAATGCLQGAPLSAMCWGRLCVCCLQLLDMCAQAAHIFRKMVEVVNHCHELGVMHRSAQRSTAHQTCVRGVLLHMQQLMHLFGGHAPNKAHQAGYLDMLTACACVSVCAPLLSMPNIATSHLTACLPALPGT